MKKSKLITFILSFVPGAGHIYLGFLSRGCIFIGVLAAAVFVVTGLLYTGAGAAWLLILFALYFVLWFIALIDSMALCEVINRGIKPDAATGENPAHISNWGEGEIAAQQNRKIIACLFSVVPGAGHMYLGYQQLGLELMTLFFFSIFFVDWLRIGLFMFIIPVIWFYSMFDTLHKAEGRKQKEDAGLSGLFGQNRNLWSRAKLLGYGLIVLGLLIIFDRIVSPLLSYEIRNYLQTGIVALLLIAGGVRILAGGFGGQNEKGGEVRSECEDGE